LAENNVNRYYFLISGLFDLILDSEKIPATSREFLDLCEGELSVEDFDELKKIYIFNDIKNVVNYKITEKYLTPSYYSVDEFKENLKDTDSFFQFLSDFYYYKKQDKRLFPETTEEDELLYHFYQNLDTFGKGFIYDYFNFELSLRNISIAISMRKRELDASNYIINNGDYCQNLLKNTNSDFGLSKEFSFIEKLNEVYELNDLALIEKKIEEIRWDWLDQYSLEDFFTKNLVFVYGIKLASVERWYSMTPESGELIFNKLIEQIKEKINFSRDMQNWR